MPAQLYDWRSTALASLGTDQTVTSGRHEYRQIQLAAAQGISVRLSG